MITFFNEETVYLGTDIKRFNCIREYLDLKKIKYKIKVYNTANRWDGRGTVKSIVGNVRGENEYEIVVSRKDYKKLQMDEIR